MEPTIEEKARAYDEARARISRAFKENRCSLGFIREIFPESAESEDERMFKAIAEGIRDEAETFGWSDFGGVPIEEILAWLEKQREKNLPSTKIEPKFREARYL